MRIILLARDRQRAQQALDELGTAARFVPGDILNEADLGAAVAMAQELGRLSVAVGCAGFGTAGRLLGRRGPLPLAEFEDVVRVNLVGTFNLARMAASAMAENEPVDGERGVIVCTSSIAAFDGLPGQAAYAAAKAGIAGMTLPLARTLPAMASGW